MSPVASGCPMTLNVIFSCAMAGAASKATAATSAVRDVFMLLLLNEGWWASRASRGLRFRVCGGDRRPAREKIDGGAHAGRLMRHAGGRQSDLDARERAHEHQVVEVAKMADAKHLARELAETRAERHVATIEDH